MLSARRYNTTGGDCQMGEADPEVEALLHRILNSDRYGCERQCPPTEIVSGISAAALPPTAASNCTSK